MNHKLLNAVHENLYIPSNICWNFCKSTKKNWTLINLKTIRTCVTLKYQTVSIKRKVFYFCPRNSYYWKIYLYLFPATTINTYPLTNSNVKIFIIVLLFNYGATVDRGTIPDFVTWWRDAHLHNAMQNLF